VHWTSFPSFVSRLHPPALSLSVYSLQLVDLLVFFLYHWLFTHYRVRLWISKYDIINNPECLNGRLLIFFIVLIEMPPLIQTATNREFQEFMSFWSYNPPACPVCFCHLWVVYLPQVRCFSHMNQGANWLWNHPWREVKAARCVFDGWRWGPHFCHQKWLPALLSQTIRHSWLLGVAQIFLHRLHFNDQQANQPKMKTSIRCGYIKYL